MEGGSHRLPPGALGLLYLGPTSQVLFPQAILPMAAMAHQPGVSAVDNSSTLARRTLLFLGMTFKALRHLILATSGTMSRSPLGPLPLLAVREPVLSLMY